MRNPKQYKQPALCLLLCSVCAVVAFAQQPLPELSPVVAGEPAGMPAVSPVTINLIDGSLDQALQAFARQTTQNLVQGPDVATVSNGVTLHLSNVQWSEALEVILKPYGFGYRKVGDTIVVSKLEKLSALEAVEPLETKVFELHFLDAGDVQDIIKGQLSARGTASVVLARGQKGWKFASASDRHSGSFASALGKLERQIDPNAKNQSDQTKSKTLIVTDVPSSLVRVAEVLTRVDSMPQQVQIEARFLEVNNELLRDIGVDFAYAHLGDTPYGFGQQFQNVIPGAFGPIADIAGDVSVLGVDPADVIPAVTGAGGLYQDIRGQHNFQVWVKLLQEDQDTKLLSAPRILTLNNQEATIIVGQKFPIIESNVSGGGGDNNTSTTLDYYENIGIQLNVVPQICDGGFINMIVHPSVSSIVGFESGRVSTSSSTNSTALTQYPIINTRETETQIMVKDGETIVIGGLLEDRKTKGQIKTPFLGDIPFIGRLFRRDTTDNKTIDLLIFLSATIVNENNYDTILAGEGAATMEGAKPVDEVDKVPAAAAVTVEPADAETMTDADE